VRRPVVLLVVALALVVVAATAAALALRGDDVGPTASADGRPADPASCAGRESGEPRECYIDAFSAMLAGADDPRPVVQEIADLARASGGFLLPNCHGIMHTVARRYAAEHGVSLASLMDFLPRTNDPGCPAGFAHGLITAAGAGAGTGAANDAVSICSDAETRYQRYSCTHGFGHAFMRMHGGDLDAALEMCRSLGADEAPDCAQGAFMDYWFAVVGADDATIAGEPVTDPRELCTGQPPEFVRACWYRAFVDSRPEGFTVEAPADFEELCGGLDAVQRDACVTAASVIGPPDPNAQLALCSLLRAADAESCVRGAKVQNLIGASTAEYLELARGCELFAGRTRPVCYGWLGKTISVVTDGRFAASGCPRLPTRAARRACTAGAAAMDEPLVTFS
jgi:hypothetical protein